MSKKSMMYHSIGAVNNQGMRISTYMCYLDHNGDKKIAEFANGKFRIASKEFPNKAEETDALDYCTISTDLIDQWSCKYDSLTGLFTHTRKQDKATHTSDTINYLYWDGLTSYFVYFPKEYQLQQLDGMAIRNTTKTMMFHAIGGVNNDNKRLSTYMCYLDHDGRKMILEIVDGIMHVAEKENKATTVVDHIDYWTISQTDRDKWSCSYDATTGLFIHTNKTTGSSHTSDCINYLTWDGKTSYFMYLPHEYTDWYLTLKNKVRVIVTNDIHGHFLGEGIDFAKLAAYKEQVIYDEGLACLLVDSGDPTQGTPFAVYDTGASIIELMNAVGYDVMTIGNHEFDNISKSIISENELSQNIRAFNGEFICSNVYCQASEGKTVNYIQKLIPSKNGSMTTIDIAGCKLLFVGITTNDVSMNIPRMDGYTIEPISVVMDHLYGEVKDVLDNETIHTVIGVSHLGSKNAEVNYTHFAEKLPFLDLILDGHSHELYIKPYTMPNSNPPKTISVVQSDCNASHYTCISIEMDDLDFPRFKIEQNEAKNLNQQNFKGNATYEKVNELIDNYKQKVDEMFSEEYASELPHTIWGGALDPEKPYPALRAVNIARHVQTNGGALAAEAMVWHATTTKSIRQKLVEKGYEDCYIIGGINGGSVRGSVSLGGAIDAASLYSVFPSQLESKSSAGYRIFCITPKLLKSILDNSVSRIILNGGKLVASEGRFLNTFGLKYTITKNTGGTQQDLTVGSNVVLTHKLRDFDENFAASEEKEISLDDDTTPILLCIEKYLSFGGDGYTMLGDDVLESVDTALFGIVGQYIKSVSNGNEFVYPPVIDDTTYDESLELNTTATNIEFKVLVDGEELYKKEIQYAFYTANMEGEPQKYSATTNGCGVFSAIRPAGGSVLGIWASGKYIELFMNSFFDINENSIMVEL